MNPYETLGLPTTASLEEIKKSYRRLAKKYHPDLNPGNKTAEKKFKEISHAFDLIGTLEAKEKFDRGETDEHKQREYEDFMSQQKQNSYYNTQKNNGRYAYSFGEDFGGEDFFSDLFGSKRGEMKLAGEDVIYRLSVGFKEAALGSEKIITLPDRKSLQVKIPAGIESGQKLRFKGLGGKGVGNGPPGDAYVVIEIEELHGFHRNGKDIEVEVPVSFMDAITGGEIKVPTLEGEVLLTLPAGVSTGTRLRVRGKGVGIGEKRGNEIVIIKVIIPKEVPPGLKAAIESLKQQYNFDPRTQE